MSEAIKKGDSKYRGPGFPVTQKTDVKLPQHGGDGEGRNLKIVSDSPLNKDQYGVKYCGPGRYI